MWPYLTVRKLGAIASETLLLLCCALAAFLIRFHQSPHLPDWVDFLPKALLIALVFQIFLHLRDVYDVQRTPSIARSAVRLAQALLLAAATLWALCFLLPSVSMERSVLALILILSPVFLTLWHLLLRIHFRSRKPSSGILVLGTGQLARELVREVLRRPELGMGIRGFLGDDPSLVGVSIVNPKVIGLYKDLLQIVSAHRVDHIVVELQDRRGRLPIDELLDFKSHGMAVEEATSLYERVTGKIALENLKPSWMIFNSGFEISKGSRMLKQIFETVLTALLLVAFLPVILLIALLIKLDSRGPIFHRQERVGQGGRAFTLWQFRSVHENAERDTGTIRAEKDDPRATRIGRWLRRCRLDELPQFYNILCGDMSLVGPRPERPEIDRELGARIPFYQLRHSVKPGITGWAQINCSYASSAENTIEELQYDLFYVRHVSPLLDALIILETVKSILVGSGS